MSALELTLLYLLAAVLGVVGCRMLKLPPMLGYLAVGVVIGPNALALAQNSEGVKHLAEFGVVFLMFVIGLEFNLPKLRSMRRHVFGLGLLQVVLTLVIVTFASLFLAVLAPSLWKMEWHTALALSGAMAMSSTAIVIKMMADRLELESEHGKRVVGVLLFQDLAVVPLLVLIPALGSPPEELFEALLVAGAKAVLLITLLLTGGQRVMRWWLTLVARRKSEELFVLNLLLVTLGLAWVTELAGLSLALGAFIAGMLISETEYKHQVELDIRPFHDILLGLFFITIGMMLDWHIVFERWPLMLVLTTLPVLFKLVLVAALAKATGGTNGVALRTGLYLAQAGEFGFVLLTLGSQNGVIPPALLNPVMASMVLSMLATPFIIMHSNTIVMKLVASEWLQQSLQMTTIARKSINTSKHVIICGYGRCGQNLARMLDKENIPYMALDLDPDRVRQAAAAGQSVVFGDAGRKEALMAAGLMRASVVIVTMSDTPLPAWVLEDREGGHTPQGPWSPRRKAYVPRSALPVYQRQLFQEAVLGDGSLAPEQSGETLFENDGVRLWRLPAVDAGIGILSVKSKMHTIGNEVLDGVIAAVKQAEGTLDVNTVFAGIVVLTVFAPSATPVWVGEQYGNAVGGKLTDIIGDWRNFAVVVGEGAQLKGDAPAHGLAPRLGGRGE